MRSALYSLILKGTYSPYEGVDMTDSQERKLKICIMGEGAVGKTSLIRRYVFDEFKDSYISTIGTKVTKRELSLKDPSSNEEVPVNLLIWDIMGQKGFRQLLQETYFYGAQGLIAVCDLTDKNTMSELEGWIKAAFSITGKVPVVFLANKCDLEDKAQFTFEELKDFASKHEGTTAYQSSAKTGESVCEAFEKISLEIMKT